MTGNAQRTSHSSRRTHAAKLACAAAAVPVLLVAGCSSGSSGESGSADKSKASPSAAPVKFKQLPDACKTLSKGTVKELTPKSDNPSGKRIGSGNSGDSGSCLWSGLKKFDYRQLTVSLKRFDSDTSRGSGDKLAGAYLKQQTDAVQSDKSNKGVKTTKVNGLGDQALSVSNTIKKKNGKGKAETFREERLVVRSANVVVSVDYAGAGFENGKTPSAADLRKKAAKAAKEAVAALK
ncbi:MAG: DUF3558 domain-containing protein [Streptomyces sp.]|uniref:DUF3558 domain-containing protein n=1 Tax=Streptomyces sp. TaxID=1931 RepID=UPI003D6AD45C